MLRVPALQLDALLGNIRKPPSVLDGLLGEDCRIAVNLQRWADADPLVAPLLYRVEFHTLNSTGQLAVAGMYAPEIRS